MRTRRVIAVAATVAVACSVSASAWPPQPTPEDPVTRPARAGDPFDVVVPVPEQGRIGVGTGELTLHVLLVNKSARPQMVYDEWNSWGYYNVTLDLRTADGVHHAVAKVHANWD